MEALHEYGDTSRVHFVQCDFKDLKKTEEVARGLKREEEQIDAVSSNKYQDTPVYIKKKKTHVQENPSSSATPAKA